MTTLQKLIVSKLFAFPLTALGAGSNPANEGRVAICHMPPGNPANAGTIVVGSAALPAHLAHGDTPGVCEAACHGNGDSCRNDTDCCSGLCSSGTCTLPCTQNGGACGTDGQCRRRRRYKTSVTLIDRPPGLSRSYSMTWIIQRRHVHAVCVHEIPEPDRVTATGHRRRP